MAFASNLMILVKSRHYKCWRNRCKDENSNQNVLCK